MQEDEDPELELRRLVEELEASIELRKHDEVASFCTKFSLQLVGLFDETLGQDECETLDTKSKIILLVIEKICNQLRSIGQIASACHDVEHFVHVRDMVAFGRMIGSEGSIGGSGNDSPLDYDKMVSFLRKSIYLFGVASPRRESKSEIYLNDSSLTCSLGTGFVKYTVDLKDVLEHEEKANLLEATKLDQLFEVLDSKISSEDNASERQFEGEAFLKIICSEWFRFSMLRLLNDDYPIDRFTILICIWIVGVESNHKLTQQLIGDLVDQIFHQEANGCIEDELIQLTQIGSFWLTHHKRFKATVGHSDAVDSMNDFDQDDDDDDDRLEEKLVQSDEDSIQSNENNNLSSEGAEKSRSKLRKLIDAELVVGSVCPICRYAPSDLLEPLKSSSSCSKCANGPKIFCSLSFRPFSLVSLDSIIRQNLNLRELVVYTPSEWLRYLMETMRPPEGSDSIAGLGDPVGKVTERVDINENFERLTMMREPPPEESMGSIEANDDDDSVSDSTAADNESSANTTGNKALKLLRDFLKHRKSQLMSGSGDKASKQLSESLQMIQFAGDRSNEAAASLPVCGSDVQLMDRLHGQLAQNRTSSGRFSIRIATTRQSDAEVGGRLMFHCGARSPVSKLMFGCGRYFDSFELVLRCGLGSMGVYECPNCECQLEQIKTLGHREAGGILSRFSNAQN